MWQRSKVNIKRHRKWRIDQTKEWRVKTGPYDVEDEKMFERKGAVLFALLRKERKTKRKLRRMSESDKIARVQRGETESKGGETKEKLGLPRLLSPGITVGLMSPN